MNKYKFQSEGVDIMSLFFLLKKKFSISKKIDSINTKKSISNPGPCISKALFKKSSAVLIFRIGGIEADAIYSFLKKGKISKRQRLKLQKNAGFFYNSDSQLSEFVSLNIRAMNNSDFYAYWDSLNQLKLANTIDINKEIITLRSLEPFWPEYCWLSTYSEINVTVVSPFVATMMRQSKNLGLIHPNTELDNCTFKFVKAPLTNGTINHNTVKIPWLDRLNKMYDEIVSTNPDVVLIGANGKPKGPYCNLNENEAAILTKILNPKVVVPMHYGLFEYVHEDPQKFVDALKTHDVPVECVVMDYKGCYIYKK